MRSLLSGAVAGAVALAGAVGFGGAQAHSADHSPRGEQAPARLQPLSHVLLSGGSGYTPKQIRKAYGLGALQRHGINGSGTTIGIVDVYGAPDIRSDLATFDKEHGLPAPPSLSIVKPAGPVPGFSGTGDQRSWAFETTLDVEWAHAMAPKAKIVLALTGVDEVEGTTGMSQIMTAERYLVDTAKVDVISQSFAATEETFPSRTAVTSLRSAFVDARHAGVPVLGASGDWGASGPRSNGTSYYDRRVVAWPASDPLVTAVGGTQLTLDSTGAQTAPPIAWGEGPYRGQGGGGGVSEYFQRPTFQSAVSSIVGTQRGMPDISMDASGGSPVSIYISFPGTSIGNTAIWGTSLASPLFAGIVSLATQLHGGHLGYLNPLLYKLGATHAAGIVDVTSGSNTVHTPSGQLVNGYQATAGFDLATGWGTVNAAKFVPELAGKPLP